MKIIDSIMREIGSTKREAIFARDFNAKWQLWFSPKQDRTGEFINEWLAAFFLEVINEGDSPTFQEGTYIDITISIENSKDYKNRRTIRTIRMSMKFHKI